MLVAVLVFASVTTQFSLDVVDAIKLGLGNNGNVVTALLSRSLAERDVTRIESTYNATFDAMTGFNRYDSSIDPRLRASDTRTLTTTAGLSGRLLMGLQYQITTDYNYELIEGGLPKGTNHIGLSGNLRQQLIRNGYGQNATILESVRESANAARDASNDVAQSIASFIADNYWMLARDRALVDIAQRSRAFAEQQLTETRRLIALGLRAPSESLQIEAALAERNAMVEIARSQVAMSESRLLQQLALPQNSAAWASSELVTSMQDPYAGLELTPEELVQSAEQHQPRLHQLAVQVEAARKRLDSATIGTKPALFIDGQWRAQRYIANDLPDGLRELPLSAYIGMGFSQPLGTTIYDVDRQIAELTMRQADATLAQALAELLASARQIAGVIAAYRVALEHRKASLTASEAARAAAERSFSVGFGTIFEVLRLQEVCIQQEAAYTSLGFDLRRARWSAARIGGLLGSLTDAE
ncbi:MAG: TolC family protein [Clostridia bacterium]|nr:TolC family protein [Deltaproteobacteria bacterium]